MSDLLEPLRSGSHRNTIAARRRNGLRCQSRIRLGKHSRVLLQARVGLLCSGKISRLQGLPELAAVKIRTSSAALTT